MKRFRTPDGAVFAGSTSEEVVTAMRDRGFYPAESPSLKIYMLDVLTRLAFYNNEEIDCSLKSGECDEFVRTLVNHGYFTEIASVSST